MKDATISPLLQDIRAAADGGATVDDLLKKLHHLAALAPLSIGSGYGAGSRMYRGTNHHRSVPSRIEEIWYPPAQRLNTFGRANRPGSPMFYCCSEQTGAFREISIKVGQYALLATWETTRPVIVHDSCRASTESCNGNTRAHQETFRSAKRFTSPPESLCESRNRA